MIEKISAITTWLTGMALIPKIIFSILIVLATILFLFLLWTPKQDKVVSKANRVEVKNIEPEYSVSVNSFKVSDNKGLRIQIIGAIHSAHINVRDGGAPWESAEKAWEHWQTFVTPNLAPSVIKDTDVFIIRHNGKPELSNRLKDILNGLFPNLIVKVHQAGSGKDKNPNISIHVSSKNIERFKIE